MDIQPGHKLHHLRCMGRSDCKGYTQDGPPRDRPRHAITKYADANGTKSVDYMILLGGYDISDVM